MLCEKCGREVETTVCPECGRTVARLGDFCYACGGRFQPKTESRAPQSEEMDFSDRVLCSDGTCIGVIGENGVCKVCGKPYAAEQ